MPSVSQKVMWQHASQPQWRGWGLGGWGWVLWLSGGGWHLAPQFHRRKGHLKTGAPGGLHVTFFSPSLTQVVLLASKESHP